MKIFFALSVLLVMPLLAAAQTIDTVLRTFTDILNLAIPVVIALAVLYFFWGLAQYILAQGSEDKRKEGLNIMIWGIIALFVMVSVWGLIALLQDTFDIQNSNPILPGEIR